MKQEKGILITPTFKDKLKILLGMNIKVIVTIEMPYYKITDLNKDVIFSSCLTRQKSIEVKAQTTKIISINNQKTIKV